MNYRRTFMAQCYEPYLSFSDLIRRHGALVCR